jgi:hypothetical protein
MAKISTHPLETILEIAAKWKSKCLISDGSIFTDEQLWTIKNINSFKRYFVDNLLYEGDESFYQKLSIQLQDSEPEVKKLCAEMIYVILLFSSNITARKKAEDIQMIWSWAGEEILDVYPNLELSFAEGVGSTGMAYNNKRWAELVFFTNWLISFKGQDVDSRNRLLSDPWLFANWLDEKDGAEKRQFRHIVLYLLFPDDFETSSSRNQKNQMINAFQLELSQGDPGIKEYDSEWVKVDKSLLAIRNILTQKSNEPVNLYLSPYKEKWLMVDSSSGSEDLYINTQTNYWLEVCNIKGRPDREVGPDALGKSLWSPQLSSDGKNIYTNMRKISDGDVVLHFTDRLGISGVSIVSGSVDDRFICLEGTEWAGKPGYRVELKDYAMLEKVIARDEIFSHQEILKKLLDDFKGLFYHKKLGLNQNAYLTNLPIQLVELFNQIYLKNTGKKIPYVDVESSVMVDEEKAIYSLSNGTEGLFVPPKDFEEMLSILKKKKNLIIQGPPGTGKSYVAKRIAYALLGVRDANRVASIQFHQSYSYEDFVQGYRPNRNKGGFDLKDGVFHRFCMKAKKDSLRPYVFIIDEINRGNLSKIFGEVMLLIEADKRGEEWAVSLTYADDDSEKFYIPSNVHIIGMMNTADRSLAMVDYALRRRFSFKDIEPGFDSAEFEKYLAAKKVSKVIVSRIQVKINELNKKIESSVDLGSGFRIGHSFFVPNEDVLDSESWYQGIIINEIAPLLREYWFDKKKSELDQEIDYLLAV